MLEKIKESLIPIIEDNGCTLFDMVYEKEKGDYYLRVFIDKEDGLDMDTCVKVSGLISEELDIIDLIKDEYYLEVSSPGAERELKTFDMILANRDKYIHIDFIDPKQGMNNVEGYIKDIVDKDITVEYMEKTRKKSIVVPYSNIKLIRLAIKF